MKEHISPLKQERLDRVWSRPYIEALTEGRIAASSRTMGRGQIMAA